MKHKIWKMESVKNEKKGMDFSCEYDSIRINV